MAARNLRVQVLSPSYFVIEGSVSSVGYLTMIALL